MTSTRALTQHVHPPGGGVVGATTAYYLTRHPKFDPSLHTITLLEASSIAAGASGKAGGLLGMWAYPECLVPLSYRLHQELAEQHGGADKWGYRRVECGSIGATVTKADLGSREATKDVAQAKNALPHTQGELEEQRLHPPTIGTQPVAANGHADSSVASVAPSPSTPSTETSESPSAENGTETTLASAYKTTNAIFELIEDAEDKEWEKLPKQDAAAATLLQDSLLPADLDWIDPKVVHHYEQMGRDGFSETAQVHPFHFTTAIAELARDAGVDIRLGAKVTNIHNDSSAGRTVEYEDRQHGNAVRTMTGVSDVIVAAGPWTGKLLPKSKVEGLRAHSVVYEADVSPYAVFTDIQLPGDWIPEHRKAMGRKRKHRGNVDPEIYARPFGEVYACGTSIGEGKRRRLFSSPRDFFLLISLPEC